MNHTLPLRDTYHDTEPTSVPDAAGWAMAAIIARAANLDIDNPHHRLTVLQTILQWATNQHTATRNTTPPTNIDPF